MTTPLSLLQHFDAPDDYRGGFAWVCGFSADARFMDRAAERFTRCVADRRAEEGYPRVALMTDPDHTPISMLDAPGVAHLPWRAGQRRPFRLQHAKLALLSFRHEADPERWCVRLLVSTGNWTQQTVEESLDLVFRVDLDSTDLTSTRDPGVAQLCADVAAGWKLLHWLQGHYDTRLLSATRSADDVSLSGLALAALSLHMEAVSRRGAGAAPRVVDNRRTSLLAQLPGLVARYGDKARNYLAMGSGFYEGGVRAGELPGVLQALRGTLEQADLLTGRAGVDVVINPEACQSIADARAAMEAAGFTLRRAVQPEEIFGSVVRRSLHAKFIFSANLRGDQAAYRQPWLYLGSGNLTGPGFARSMSPQGGNLECGVVFDPGSLECRRDGGKSERFIGRHLPFDPESPPLGADLHLQAGSAMPPREATYLSAPVAWLVWKDGVLSPPDGEAFDGAVLDLQGRALTADAEGAFEWVGERPRQVRITWPAHTPEHRADIPVLDALGRLAARELKPLGVDEALWQLTSFPAYPDPGEEGDDDKEHGSGGKGSGRWASGEAGQPIRKMMVLLEQIASLQVELPQADWPAWCARLEQTLCQLSEAPCVAAFRALGLNPLSPLRQAAFRPAYAEDGAARAGRAYEDLLGRVADAWGVGDGRMLGGE